MLPFFITIDTEGDGLWDNPKEIKTENSLFIPRFQALCEKYGFIPIWLTDYEMAMDDRYVAFIREKVQKGLCEVGLHVHALNNPPIYPLEGEKTRRNPYLIEYPEDVMREKIKTLIDLIENRMGIKAISHRAGRWTINQAYIDVLIDMGIKYDCTVTPSVDWTSNRGVTAGSKGSNYSSYKNGKSTLRGSQPGKGLIEYPVSIVKCEKIIIPNIFTVKSFGRSIKAFIKKRPLWLRPNGNNLSEMKYVLKRIKATDVGFAEFMIHSSELMPAGSPTFKDEKAIDKFYDDCDKLFAYAKKLGFCGATFDQLEKESN